MLDTTHSAVGAPRARTLDGFVSLVDNGEGVKLHDLEPLTTLLVRTRNSLYRIVTSRQTEVFVQGGLFFPEMTEARLDGASLGGSFLKTGWIGLGLCMEIYAEGRRIVTSPVRSISCQPVSAAQ